MKKAAEADLVIRMCGKIACHVEVSFSKVVHASFLSFLPVYLNFMADPNEQLPPGWTAEWQVTMLFF
jgi:hypothetical protein